MAVALDSTAVRQPGYHWQARSDAGTIADLSRLTADRDGRKHDEQTERHPDRVQEQRLEFEPGGVLHQQSEQSAPEAHDQNATQEKIWINSGHVKIAAAEQT